MATEDQRSRADRLRRDIRKRLDDAQSPAAPRTPRELAEQAAEQAKKEAEEAARRRR